MTLETLQTERKFLGFSVLLLKRFLLEMHIVTKDWLIQPSFIPQSGAKAHQKAINLSTNVTCIFYQIP